MKTRFMLYAFIIGCTMLFVQSAQAQVTAVKYQLRFNPDNCRWDAYLIIISGTAITSAQRAQFNSQFSVVVPTGSFVNVAQNYMPLQNNQNYTGTQPLIWQKSSVIIAPAAEPQSDFISITPTLSPTSFYNNLYPGDSIRLFSLNITPVTNCGSGVRIFRNEIDPNSSAPGMEGGDFSNGFTMGSPNQLYTGNAPQVFPPRPALSATTACSAGVEIDLTATTAACLGALTYQWTGPNGYSGTTQDVKISPATSANAGVYFVTVTDARGCSSTMSIMTEAKPTAGPDQEACADSNTTLIGSNPNSGLWSAHPSNGPGASLGLTVNGSANLSFDDTASGLYSYIYTSGNCSDTTNINVIVPDAGEDPAPVGCFSSGTATMAATGTGTWSVSGASAGSANITDPNNPATTVSGFTAPGIYYLIWAVGSCTDIAQIIVNDNCACTINDNSLFPVSPSSYCGTSGILNISGENASPGGGAYIWQYSLNGGNFANASGTNNQQNYTTPSHTLGTHRYRRIYTINGDPICLDTSNVVLFTVNAVPVIPSGLNAVPNPVCLGNAVNLSVTNNSGAVYTWTASSPNAGLAPSTTSNATMNALVSGSYTISVTQTVNGCTSDPSTTIVQVSPTPATPTALTVSSTNPANCGGSNGSISISGLLPNTSYTLNYFKNALQLFANLTSNGSGVILLNNQTAGTYTNFSVSNAAGCTSGVYAGPVTLSDPDAPPAPSNLMADPNPTCANVSVSLSVTNNPGATYNWTASSPNAGLINSTTNSTTMLPVISGFYTINVTQTVSGCTSVPASIGISINNTPPTPTNLTVSFTNPTTCGGSNGTISLSGLMSLTAYTINFKKNNVAANVSVTTNGSGVAVLTGLTLGVYTDFSITNITGCTSGVYPGPVTLSDPTTPSAPANLTANPNPVCLGNQVSLSVSPVSGATYNWSASSPNAGLIAANAANTSMTPTQTGNYTVSVTVTVAGCTSPVSTVSVNVNPVPPTPTAGNFTSTNPTSCGGNNGSISVSGFLPNTAYTINYQRNGIPSTANITTNGSGVATISNLTAGSYTNFTIVNQFNCPSGTFAGPVNLSDPNAPSAPAGLTANPNPVCAGLTVNLSVTNNPGAVYVWSASSPNAGLITSATSSTSMVPIQAGTYTISVTQNVAGCTSPASTINVVVNPLPPTPNAGTVSATNPTVCAGSDGAISLTGLTPNGSFTINYSRNGNPLSANVTANGSGVATITGLNSGSYTGFSITNSDNCTSGTYNGIVSLSDPNAPAAPANLTAIPNPVCLGTTVNLSVTNNTGAIYNWTASSVNAGLVASTVNSTLMTATLAGSYTINVTQTVAGCTSPPASVVVVVHPIPPTLAPANVTSTNPTTCNGTNGQILLSGLPPNTAYTLNYNKNGNPETVAITTNGSGQATVSGLTAGSYTNFRLTGAGSCVGGTYAGPVTLSDPSAPSAPTGLNAQPNPVCQGLPINLSVTNNPGAVYAWSASSPNAGLIASATNATSMNALASGVYIISVTQTVNNCVSPAATLSVTVNPLPPTPSAATVQSVNPSACNGIDGSISFSGLPANTQFTLNYSRNGSPQSIQFTSNGSGIAVLTGLNAGSYANFSLTNASNCNSGSYGGPVALTDPVPPAPPSGLNANPDPSCLGTPVALNATGAPGAIYTWSASSPAAGLNPGTGNNNSMTATAPGVYAISVTQTVNGCISPASTINVMVNALPPSIGPSSVSAIDPTCAGNNGTISISGLAPNTTYSINYKRNQQPQIANTVTTGTGVAFIFGLSAGTYTDFSVTNSFGCSSGTFAGPVVLSDPGLPSAPTGLVFSPDQVCIRSTVNLSVDNNPGATYGWSVSNIGAGLSFSNTNTATMMPTSAGFYTVSVTQTINGCTSPAATVIIEVKGDCFNPDFDVTYANVSLSGNLSTNDIPLPIRNYGTATALSGNPSACLPNVNQDGTYSFVCSSPGKYQFRVPVCTGPSTPMCASIAFEITVLQPFVSNNPPVVNHDYIRTKRNTPIIINMLANDKCQSFPNCSLNNPTITMAPQNGVFNLQTNTYTPNAGFIGFDTMRYSVCQTPLVTPKNCEEAFIYITVISDNAPNVTNAMDDYGQTPMDTPLIKSAAQGVKANDSDPEGHLQFITPMNVTIPGKGSFVIDIDGSYVFTPFTGFTGPVDCPYEVCDNFTDQACDIATLRILVEPFNPVGSVGNLVWHDMNGDGIQNPGEPGLSGITVRLMNPNGSISATTTTNTSGIYQFDNVVAGTYYLRFMPPSQYSFTFAKIGNNPNIDSDVTAVNGAGTTSTFVIAPGEARTDMDAGLYVCAQIGDRVWYDTNKNDVWNTQENGINGLRVNIWRNHFGAWIIWDYTFTGQKPDSPSDDGFYLFCVPPGQYYVQVIMPPLGLVQALPNRGNNPLIDSDLTNANGSGTTSSFSVGSGQNKLDIGAGYYPMALAGNLVWKDENMNGVQDPWEAKVGGVLVEAFDADTHAKLAQAITDDQGAYELDYLQKKDIYLKFNVPAGFAATYPGASTDDKDSDVDHTFGPNTTRKVSMIPGVNNQNIDLGIAFGILPVDWLDVSALKYQDHHLISWSTARESNVSHYELERKVDENGTFETILNNISASGNSNKINFYAEKDRDISNSGVYYYRVRQVDTDSRFTYSKIVSVFANGEAAVKVYPNPARFSANIDLILTDESEVKIELMDANSRIIQLISKTHLAQAGEHSFALNLNDLSAGVYTIAITVDNQVMYRKLIKID
jgi:hypothetical protein